MKCVLGVGCVEMLNNISEQSVRKLKANYTKLTEILYIFFGFHTANVVQLADRIEGRLKSAAA